VTLNDADIRRQPAALAGIVADTTAMSFTMISEPKVGALLGALAASKPAGRLLELGTGTGHGTAWLLDGMDAASTLDTVDTDERVVDVARKHLGGDPRVRFHVQDGAEFLNACDPGQFDLIYADAWPGKFSHLDAALALLRPGGIYVIDDLLPQPNWPEGHDKKAINLEKVLDERKDLSVTKMIWATGIIIGCKKV